MRTISFNKLDNSVPCIKCKVARVPANRPLRPCEVCRAQGTEKTVPSTDGGVHKKLPAARVVTEDGREIYVDKFGRQVDNPGYDLEHDPRGYAFTGKGKDKGVIIS